MFWQMTLRCISYSSFPLPPHNHLIPGLWNWSPFQPPCPFLFFLPRPDHHQPDSTRKCQIKISQMPLIMQLAYPKVHCVLFLMALNKDSFVCFPGPSLRSRFHLAYLTSFSSISNLLFQLAPSKLHKAHLFPSHQRRSPLSPILS